MNDKELKHCEIKEIVLTANAGSTLHYAEKEALEVCTENQTDVSLEFSETRITVKYDDLMKCFKKHL
jgi:hypothetical protein